MSRASRAILVTLLALVVSFLIMLDNWRLTGILFEFYQMAHHETGVVIALSFAAGWLTSELLH